MPDPQRILGHHLWPLLLALLLPTVSPAWAAPADNAAPAAATAPSTATAPAAALPQVDLTRLGQDIAQLTAAPHRLAGSPQGRAAGDHIIARLREMGFGDEQLFVQNFDLAQIQVNAGDCYFEHDGQRVAMEPLRPNGLALPVTGPEGITGQTVYLGDGAWDRFVGQELRGKIAVLDFAGGHHFLRAFSRGASAVIFVGPAGASVGHWVASHAPLPRFHVSREVAQAHGLLTGATIRLFSKMRFAPAVGRNIFVLIPGAQAPADPAAAGQPLVALACEYDTYGLLPINAPGQRSAANAAGLLAAAEHLRAHPLPGNVLLAFFDGNAQDQLGQMFFYFARTQYAPEAGPGTLLQMAADRDQERQDLEADLGALQDPVAVIEQRSLDSRAAAVRTLLLRAVERQYDEHNEELTAWRIEKVEILRERKKAEKARLEKDAAPAGSSAQDADAGEADEPQALAQNEQELDALIESGQKYKDDLKKLRLAMMAAKMPADQDEPSSTRLFAELIAGARARRQDRLQQVEIEQQQLRSYQQLGAALAKMDLLSMAWLDIAPSAVPWTITVPSAVRDPGGMVTNQGVSRWIGDLCGDGRGAEFWPLCGGNPVNVQANAWQWRVSSQASFLIELSSIGSTWSPPGVPDEPAADVPAYAPRLAQALSFFENLAAQNELTRVRLPARLPSLIFQVPQWIGNGRYDGCFVRKYGGASIEAEEPVPAATVLIQGRDSFHPLPPPDRVGGKLTTSSANGGFWCFTDAGFRDRAIITATLPDEQGRITAITQLQPGGEMAGVGKWNKPSWFSPKVNNQLAMFSVSRCAVLLNVREVLGPVGPERLKLLNGVNDSPPKELNCTLSQEVAALYFRHLKRFKMLQAPQLLLDNSATTPAGRGYAPRADGLDALSHGSADLWTLDEDRLGNLRRHNILQNMLEKLHARAESSQLQARELALNDPAAATAHELASLGYSHRVYQPVRDVTNDLIKAVVILLLLAIPFCFALERVLIGSPIVYTQILGFSGFFALVFLILYFVHPAFRFATFPIIVLLAFVIIIMSGMVIYIMWSKFDYEVKKLQGLATASHRSTRSYRGTVVAAVALGISTMRRRPLRTTLTAITIVLLTFTILFFGSFNSEGGARLVYREPGGKRPLVEVRAPAGGKLDPKLVSALRSLWREAAPSFTVLLEQQQNGLQFPGLLPDGGLFAFSAWRSLDPRELELYPQLRQSLTGDVDGFIREGGIFLPPALYQKVKALTGSGAIDLLGRKLVLRGSFDPVILKSARSVNGDPFLPADIEEMRRLLEMQYPRDQEAVDQKLREIDLGDFPLLDPETVVFVSLPPRADSAAAQSITFVPRDEQIARQIAAEIVTIADLHVGVSASGQRFAAIYYTQFSFSGLSQVLVPLLLGGLIVFSTMLSSVSDREKEIFTFSAVGLAPSHVATLFFAEAAVYAVIGGMGGYLFSQVFGKTVEELARHGWCQAPGMNYSSMNAMLTIVMVMVTVLLSTIYPAFKASRAANPGVQRRWRMPAPQGDHLDILFPFTVSAYDMIGLVSFLEEYLLSHRDKSIGSFAADQVSVEHVGGRFLIHATVWLQPFDQGVSQTFTLETVPSDIPGIDEVRIQMQRLSGSPAIWQRSSKVFIHDIRQQFIFWRTITQEAMEHYHQMTMDRFQLASSEGADATG